MSNSHIVRPRWGKLRPFGGLQQREASSSGELVAGVTMYRNLPEGGEAYEVNYISLGARSDTAQNMLEALQGNDLTVRRVGSCDADANYVGTVKENANQAQDIKSVEPEFSEKAKQQMRAVIAKDDAAKAAAA